MSTQLGALKAGRRGVTTRERVPLFRKSTKGYFSFFPPVRDKKGQNRSQKRLRSVKPGPRNKPGISDFPGEGASLPEGASGISGGPPLVDRTMADPELVARLTGAEHTEILIEDAARQYGMVVAPDGISGNMIFRTLTFLGAEAGHGAPVVNIDKIFVDTSRASADYTNAIFLAKSLVKSQKS